MISYPCSEAVSDSTESKPPDLLLALEFRNYGEFNF